MDSFYQRYVYARIGSETSRRKACPPRLPSGFCLASCSHRIKDMPCLWSGEESFAGERGKMEEDLNICQTGAAEFCYASDFWLFLLVLGGEKKKNCRHPLQECVPISHAITIQNMLCNEAAAGNSNENSANCFLLTVQLNYKANQFDLLILFYFFYLFLSSTVNFWSSKTELEYLMHTRLSPSLRYLKGFLTVAELLQIPGTREWMRGGLEG